MQVAHSPGLRRPDRADTVAKATPPPLETKHEGYDVSAGQPQHVSQAWQLVRGLRTARSESSPGNDDVKGPEVPEVKSLSLVGAKRSTQFGATKTSLGRRKGRKGVRRAGKGKRAKGAVYGLPPTLDVSVQIDKTYRFYVASSPGTSLNVTDADLQCVAGMYVTVVNSTAKSLASSFHLRGIDYWPSPQAAGGGATAFDIEEFYTIVPQFERESVKDNSLPPGVTLGTPTVWKPRADGPLAGWLTYAASASTVLTFFAPVAGAIIDVHMSHRIKNVLSGVDRTGLGTIALGAFGWPHLDGFGSKKIIPIGRALVA